MLLQQVVQVNADTELGSRMLRVDHAGEHGAVNIYSGQIFMARFTAPGMVDELREFRAHEQRHRAIFGAELQRRGWRRCPMYLLCGFGGLLLGLVSGLLGAGAVAATTVAVERVVLRHLQQQLLELRDVDTAAVAAISAIVAEEQQHHDQSARHLKPGGFWMRVLGPIVSGVTEAVIRVGMRR